MRKTYVKGGVFISALHDATASGDIAKTVLMPGDPLRAKFTAEAYSENPVQFNTIRNMFGYTSTYKGKKISVMGNSMGMASIGIYSYKLYKFHEVENIIRTGSAGAYTNTLKLFDLVFADSARSESTFAKAQADVDGGVQTPSIKLDVKIETATARVDRPLTKARIHFSDVFYHEGNVGGHREFFERHDCICVEIESFALLHNAKILNKCTACLLTINNSLVIRTETTARERQTSFHDMMLIALGTVVTL